MNNISIRDKALYEGVVTNIKDSIDLVDTIEMISNSSDIMRSLILDDLMEYIETSDKTEHEYLLKVFKSLDGLPILIKKYYRNEIDKEVAYLKDIGE